MFLSIWIISPQLLAQGQQKYTLEGKVTLFGTDEPIPYVNVLIKELNVWGVSDANGAFKITGIIPGTHTLESSSLGYQTVKYPITVNRNVTGFKIQLKEENLTLDDVVVTAVRGGSMNSSSKVEKAAIEHVQASSLADVMQLMPGNIIANPTLTASNSVTIRSIGDAGSLNGRGVGLMINGAPVSSDASMSLPESSTVTANTIDFRNYSTDNIESVEVLKGVLSAEYGNVTSGAILVTTKAGVTPFDVRIKADPNTKAVAISKGFAISDNGGNINIDIDYARAFKKWISPVDVFDRTTMGLTYSNTFNKEKTPFRFNARLSGYLSGNNVDTDPDISKLDYSRNRTKNLTLSMYGNWQLNKSWISSLNYNLSGTYQNKTTKNYTVSSKLPVATTNSLVDGISVGYFTDAFNEEDERIEDIPIYFNAKLSGNLNKKIGNIFSKTILGAEFNTQGNKGRGYYYLSGTPQFFRERHYSDVPFLSDLSAFLEEKLTIPVYKKTSLEVSAGVRANKMIIDGYNYDPTMEPRFNGKYIIVPERRNGALRSFALRGGWGILKRLPSIGQLYPDPLYKDETLFQYRNTATGESLALIQTTVIDSKLDYNLKPAKTTNMELGFDFNLFGITGEITYFNENLTDGITSNSTFLSESYDYYNTVTSATASPKYENGRVYVKNANGVYEALSYSTKRRFKSYSKPDNRGQVKKWGVEYDLNLGKIKAVNTSVLVNGAYIRSNYSTPGLQYTYNAYVDPIDPTILVPYVAIYENDNTVELGSGNERLSTNIHLVTNIPSIRMVISLVTQCIWLNNSWNDFDETKIYKLDSNGNPVYGDYDNQNNTEVLYRDPISYMDMDGVIRPFSDYWTTSDQNLKTRLSTLIESQNRSYWFKKSGYKPYFMANIRVTKEIGKLAALSFYANNFTNSRPIMKNKARPNATGGRMNTPIYFGAELKLTF